MPDTPKSYEYTLPEGYLMEQQFRDKLDALVTEAAMSNELAQKFVDLHIELTEDFVRRLQEAAAQETPAPTLEETVEKTKALKVTEYTPENQN